MDNTNINNNYDDFSISSRGQFKETLKRFARNKAAVFGLIVIIILTICALFPAQISGPDYTTLHLDRKFLPPSKDFILGTDELGRDMFTRIVWGARTSLTIGLSAISIATLIGVTIGCISGYYGGIIDNILMRAIDILMAVPNLLLGISVVAALGSSMYTIIIAIGIGNIAPFARVSRSAVITVRDQEYIEAAKATGAEDFRIILKYVLPNAMAPIIVQISMGIATSILSISGLSFIGLGVPAPTPEWGSMLSTGRSFIRDYWYVITFPGLAIMLTVFAFNLFGDGLRDALDPRLKQ